MMIAYDVYNGAFSIASKSDIDDQNVLLATVRFTFKVKQFVHTCLGTNKIMC
jgi:hypothetical protein